MEKNITNVTHQPSQVLVWGGSTHELVSLPKEVWVEILHRLSSFGANWHLALTSKFHLGLFWETLCEVALKPGLLSSNLPHHEALQLLSKDIDSRKDDSYRAIGTLGLEELAKKGITDPRYISKIKHGELTEQQVLVAQEIDQIFKVKDYDPDIHTLQCALKNEWIKTYVIEGKIKLSTLRDITFSGLMAMRDEGVQKWLEGNNWQHVDQIITLNEHRDAYGSLVIRKAKIRDAVSKGRVSIAQLDKTTLVGSSMFDSDYGPQVLSWLESGNNWSRIREILTLKSSDARRAMLKEIGYVEPPKPPQQQQPAMTNSLMSYSPDFGMIYAGSVSSSSPIAGGLIAFGVLVMGLGAMINGTFNTDTRKNSASGYETL